MRFRVVRRQCRAGNQHIRYTPADIAVAVHGFVADTGDKARATYLEYEHRMMAEGLAELACPAPPRRRPRRSPNPGGMHAGDLPADEELSMRQMR